MAFCNHTHSIIGPRSILAQGIFTIVPEPEKDADAIPQRKNHEHGDSDVSAGLFHSNCELIYLCCRPLVVEPTGCDKIIDGVHVCHVYDTDVAPRNRGSLQWRDLRWRDRCRRFWRPRRGTANEDQRGPFRRRDDFCG